MYKGQCTNHLNNGAAWPRGVRKRSDVSSDLFFGLAFSPPHSTGYIHGSSRTSRPNHRYPSRPGCRTHRTRCGAPSSAPLHIETLARLIHRAVQLQHGINTPAPYPARADVDETHRSSTAAPPTARQVFAGQACAYTHRYPLRCRRKKANAILARVT